MDPKDLEQISRKLAFALGVPFDAISVSFKDGKLIVEISQQYIDELGNSIPSTIYKTPSESLKRLAGLALLTGIAFGPQVVKAISKAK